MSKETCSRFIRDNFYPTGIVFSTEKARAIIGKNNLTPSQFIRPFGQFKAELRIGNYTRTIQNFRLDFYDSENFTPLTQEQSVRTIENVMSNPTICPDIPVYNLKYRNQSYKVPDNIISKLNNFSFPWFDEYASTIVEINKFNEYELYQQPLCLIYFGALDDPVNLIKPSYNDQKKIPLLLREGIYDINMPTVIIILNDKSSDSPLISDAQKTQYIENFRHEFQNNYLLYWEINDLNSDSMQVQNDKNLFYYKDDIWYRYFHKTELSFTQESIMTVRGRFISLSARKKFHNMIDDFFNKYVIKEIEKKLSGIERYIQENKKGFKNTILGFLKTDNQHQNRWNNQFRMYMLSSSEFQEYFIATVYFYFQLYDQAKEILGYFMEDVKKKSQRHYNSAFELQKMCSFMSSPMSKETAFEPFDQHVLNKNYSQACRSLFFGIKASEQKSNFGKLPTILTKVCGYLKNLSNYTDSQHLTSIRPIVLEQNSIYYLVMTPMKKRKFFMTMIEAAQKYLKESKIKIFIKYAFCDFLYMKEFLDSHYDNSFLIAKDFITDSLGNLSQLLLFFPGSLAFYQRNIENCIYYSEDQNTLRANKIMDNLNKLFRSVSNIEAGKKNGTILGDYNIQDFAVPEIDNTSILVIEEQDYLINSSDNMNFFANPANWSYFDKYDYVPVKKIFLCLTPPDIMALKNLDDIVQNKQNFSNFFSKRKFHINVKNKIYVRFIITNPLPFNLPISKMKLIIDFTYKEKESTGQVENSTAPQTEEQSLSTIEPNNQTNLDYLCEEKALQLNKFSSQKIELYLQVFKEGKINIKGVEFSLGGSTLIKHYFNKKKKSKLYKYVKSKRKNSVSTSTNTSNRKMSESSQNSTGSRGSSRSGYQPHINYKEDIICDIVDNNHDINIQFPLGKEIQLYKDQFFLMPIKIINNSHIRIKRFCFYFNDGIHNFTSGNKNDDLNGCCFFNEIIYKEIEIGNDKTDGKNEKTLYVPILPRKKGDLFLKILFKYEEDKTFNDNEVQRFLVKIKVKDSFNFIFKEKIDQFLPHLTQFQLNSICTIKNNCLLENFTLSQHIYHNDDFEVLQNGNEWQKTDNKDYVVLYNKFIFNKKVNEQNDNDNIDINRNDNEYVVKMKHQKLNQKISELEQNYKFDETNYDGILTSKEQSHIKKKLCYLIAKNNLIFNWSAVEKQTQKEIKGLYIQKPNLKIPAINVQFLTQLLISSINMKSSINKIDDSNTLCTLTLTINKNVFKEINDVKSFDIYINEKYNEKVNWIGLNKYSISNNNNEKDKSDEKEQGENHIVNLDFNCIIREKGEYDLNQIGMTIYSNIPIQQPKKIEQIFSPIIVQIE